MASPMHWRMDPSMATVLGPSMDEAMFDQVSAMAGAVDDHEQLWRPSWPPGVGHDGVHDCVHDGSR